MIYVDPGEPNPTQQARLSRQAIEALHAAGASTASDRL